MIFFEELGLPDDNPTDMPAELKQSELHRGLYFPIINLPGNEPMDEYPISDCFVTDTNIGQSDPTVKCDGGDGNPLVCTQHGIGWTLLGMASCSDDETPDYYTNIAALKLKEWIDWSVRNYIK